MRAGRPCELHALARQRDPAARAAVSSGKVRSTASSVTREVVGIAGEHRPAERALALAEERPDVGGHEAGEVEGVLDAGLLRLGADVVAVVEGDRALRLAGRACARTCSPMAAARLGHVALRVARAQRAAPPRSVMPVRARSRSAGSCALVWSVSRSGTTPRRTQLGQHVGGVAEQADGERPARGLRLARAGAAPRRGSRAITSR